jgi:hypothetical protein
MSIRQAFGAGFPVLSTGEGEAIPPFSFPVPGLIVSIPSSPPPPAQIESAEPNRQCTGGTWRRCLPSFSAKAAPAIPADSNSSPCLGYS